MAKSNWLRLYGILVATLTCTSALNGVDSIVTFFINKYPENKTEKIAAEEIDCKHGINGLCCPTTWDTSGIMIAYGGYITTSNLSGQVTLPFAGQSPNFSFIITPQIKPIFMLGGTVHHWEIPTTAHAAYYTINRGYDKETKTYFWNTQQGTPPKKGIIPLNAIVIFQPTDNVIIPLGIAITSGDAQYRLPPLYIKQGSHFAQAALEALRIKNFFTPVRNIYKKQQDRYYSKQISTTSSTR